MSLVPPLVGVIIFVSIGINILNTVILGDVVPDAVTGVNVDVAIGSGPRLRSSQELFSGDIIPSAVRSSNYAVSELHHYQHRSAVHHCRYENALLIYCSLVDAVAHAVSSSAVSITHRHYSYFRSNVDAKSSAVAPSKRESSGNVISRDLRLLHDHPRRR